jgi:MFS family permease
VTAAAVRLGLRANAAQFALLVALNAFVGAMVGLERSVLPLVGEDEFGLASKSAILSFVIAFGIAKALANLAAGGLADRVGRKRLLLLGWLLALPVPLLIAFAPSWWVIVVANLFLGLNQGLAWSMTVVMKIDLVGPVRRGLALGLNESAGYLGVAVAALATGALAAAFAPRTIVWVGAAVIAGIGTVASALFVRDTGAHVRHEQRSHGHAVAGSLRQAFARGTLRDPVLRACSQAGLVNNLNDALAWGLAPLYLAANGASVTEVGIVAGIYPAVWGAGQLATGWLSDHTGRKPLIVAGMLTQAGALALLVAGGGAFAPALVAAILLGVGTALVYPTLIAGVSDVAQPVERAQLVGVYRFWRDFGFVVGAVVAGVVADGLGAGWAIALVAALTAGSGVWVAVTRWASHPRPRPRWRRTASDLLAEARERIAPRLEPERAHEAASHGALLIDLRSQDERRREGVIPGSLHIPRSVLEWRVDPDSGYMNPHIGGLERRLVLFCAEGFSSTLAAATVRELGCSKATDMVGGFAAWKAAGLPVRRLAEDVRPDVGLRPGMGSPEPFEPGPSVTERTVSRSNQNAKEAEMRAIECPCGHHLEGADDDELVALARSHIEEHHPEMERSDEQLRARVAADSYDLDPK